MSTIKKTYKNSLALSLLSNMVKVSSTYLNQSEGLNLLLINHFSSKWHMKILAKTGPNGAFYLFCFV